MTEDLVAGLIIGAFVATVAALAVVKVAEIHRKTKRTLARWGRTRVALTQTARRRKGRR
jgi:hypothetical protein